MQRFRDYAVNEMRVGPAQRAHLSPECGGIWSSPGECHRSVEDATRSGQGALPVLDSLSGQQFDRDGTLSEEELGFR